MKINIYVDGVAVGTREGCDVLVNGAPCRRASAGGPFYHAGLPRDVCVACMARVSAGGPLAFETSRYDTVDERHTTQAPAPAVATPEAPAEIAPPLFPACPACGARAFAVRQVLSEVRPYDWDAAGLRFAPSGDPTAEQTTTYHCRACGVDVPPHLLVDWIS